MHRNRYRQLFREGKCITKIREMTEIVTEGICYRHVHYEQVPLKWFYHNTKRSVFYLTLAEFPARRVREASPLSTSHFAYDSYYYNNKMLNFRENKTSAQFFAHRGKFIQIMM